MKKIAIIGAGISGLFFANLLKNNSDYDFTIFEKNTSLNTDDSYGIQLSANSIKLLNEIGFNNLDKNQIYNPKKINFIGYGHKASCHGPSLHARYGPVRDFGGARFHLRVAQCRRRGRIQTRATQMLCTYLTLR